MLKAHLTMDRNNVKVVDQPSRSFLVAFPGLLARQWAQAAAILTDTSGDPSTLGACGMLCHMTSMGGYGRGQYFYGTGSNVTTVASYADNQGIVIGTGTGAVLPDDNKLGAQIRSGETSGKMMYFGTAVYGLTINGTTDEASFTVEALFKNVSGESIDVAEVGIYARGAGDAYYSFCIIRDLLDEAVPVADGEYLKVTYTISIAT